MANVRCALSVPFLGTIAALQLGLIEPQAFASCTGPCVEMAVAVENGGVWGEQPASRQFLYGGRPNAQGRRDEPYSIHVKASYTPAGPFWCDGFLYGEWACPHAPSTWTVSPSGAGGIGAIIYPDGCRITQQVADVRISAFGPVTVRCVVGAAEDSLLLNMWGFDLKANHGQPFVRASTIDFTGILTHAVPITPYYEGSYLVKPWFWKSFISAVGDFGEFEHVFSWTSEPAYTWPGQIVIHTAVECKVRVQNPFAPDPNRNHDFCRETVEALPPLPRPGWNTIPDPIVANGDPNWQNGVLQFPHFPQFKTIGQNTNADERWLEENGIIYTPWYSDARYTYLPAVFYRDIARKVWSAPIPGPNQGLWYNGSKPYRVKRMWRDNWWIDAGDKPTRVWLNLALRWADLPLLSDEDYTSFSTAGHRLPAGWTDWNDLQTELDVAINPPGAANRCPCGDPAHTETRKQSNIWHEDSGYNSPSTELLGHQSRFHVALRDNPAADVNLRVESHVAATPESLLAAAEVKCYGDGGANDTMHKFTLLLDQDYLTRASARHNHWYKGLRIFKLVEGPWVWMWITVDSLW